MNSTSLKALFPDDAQECGIVKKLIDEALRRKVDEGAASAISKLYIIQMIKDSFHLTHIFNQTLNCPTNGPYGATQDGVENIERGAKKLFVDAMKRLKTTFIVDKAGMITRRETPQLANDASNAVEQQVDKLPHLAEVGPFPSDRPRVVGTIQLRCGLRNCLRRAAHESTTIYTLMEMGLETILDELAEVGKKSNDVKLRRLLHILCLIDDPAFPATEYKRV